MRFTTRSRPHVCPPCRVTLSRSSFTTISLQHTRSSQKARALALSPLDCTAAQNLVQRSVADARRRISRRPLATQQHVQINVSYDSREKRKAPYIPIQRQHSAPKVQQHGPGDFKTASPVLVELSRIQQDMLRRIHELSTKTIQALDQTPEAKNSLSVAMSIPYEEVFQTLSSEDLPTECRNLIEQIRSANKGRSFGAVKHDLDLVAQYRERNQSRVTNSTACDVLVRLGIVDESKRSTNPHRVSSADSGAGVGGRRRPSLSSMVSSPTAPKQSLQKALIKPQIQPSPTAKAGTKTVASHDLILAPVEVRSTAEVPQLSHDLARVLFNSGIYQLQDQRSRVFNFDPYLEHIMPVSEFNFGALTPYQTSSEDQQLIQIARAHEKRYIGSSSSLTAALSHFHFLISNWRELNIRNFSRGFEEHLNTFTNLSKSPAAIFLRYRDGVYAVDADKELDEPNILMSLGKCMEKLLTLETDEYEKWRRSNAATNVEPIGDQPEAFHYSQQGRFLLRSQLDARDPRLPGTGYFDLKTRAVAGVRMNLRDHEVGMGYQIKQVLGAWESYEREYYDMMRSTFLKYSLQARMGSMDGIFVAYHNIARIFGFQYIPLEEMDVALHGQSDTCLGDQEFRFSINFLEEIFNIATEKFPQKSLRIHFETYNPSSGKVATKPHMNIFIEAMSEDNIVAIQNSQKAAFEEFERKFLISEDASDIAVSEAELAAAAGEEISDNSEPSQDEDANNTAINTFTPQPVGPATSDGDKEFLGKLTISQIPPRKQIMGLKLTLQNKVNDKPVTRPCDIGSAARWTIDYSLEIKGDEEARKAYTLCKNRRVSAMGSVIRGNNDRFMRTIRELSQRGAEWRKRQDELDAKRERVVYETR